MIKRLLHILLMLMLASTASIAKPVCSNSPCVVKIAPVSLDDTPVYFDASDTTKVKKETDDKKKIKEIPQARRQAKPEKLVLAPVDTLLGNKGKVKPARQRRPDGLVRPPEIPRRNNN